MNHSAKIEPQKVLFHFCRICIVVAFFIYLSSCSNHCDEAQIQDRLTSSQFINTPSTTKLILYQNSIPPSGDLLKEHPEHNVFLGLGLVSIVPYSSIAGIEIGADFVLTQQGKTEAASGWKICRGPNDEEAYEIITARKEFMNIIDVKHSGTNTSVTFTWQWIPTKIGEALGTPRTKKNSHAQLFYKNNDCILDEEDIN